MDHPRGRKPLLPHGRENRVTARTHRTQPRASCVAHASACTTEGVFPGDQTNPLGLHGGCPGPACRSGSSLQQLKSKSPDLVTKINEWLKGLFGVTVTTIDFDTDADEFVTVKYEEAGTEFDVSLTFTLKDDKTVDFVEDGSQYKSVLHRCEGAASAPAAAPKK